MYLASCQPLYCKTTSHPRYDIKWCFNLINLCTVLCHVPHDNNARQIVAHSFLAPILNTISRPLSPTYSASPVYLHFLQILYSLTLCS